MDGIDIIGIVLTVIEIFSNRRGNRVDKCDYVPKVVRRNADDLLSVAADKKFHDWHTKFELYAHDIDPLILQHGSSPLTVGHNALIRTKFYSQRWMAKTSYSTVKHSFGSAIRARFWYREFREIVLMFAISNIEQFCEPL